MLLEKVTADSAAAATGIARQHCKSFLDAIRALNRNASISLERGKIRVTFAGSSHPTGGCDVQLSDAGYGHLSLSVHGYPRVLEVYESVAEPTVLHRAGFRTISLYNLTGFLRRTLPVR